VVYESSVGHFTQCWQIRRGPWPRIAALKANWCLQASTWGIVLISTLISELASALALSQSTSRELRFILASGIQWEHWKIVKRLASVYQWLGGWNHINEVDVMWTSAVVLLNKSIALWEEGAHGVDSTDTGWWDTPATLMDSSMFGH